MGAPNLLIDMNPSVQGVEDNNLANKDAIYFSGHKFVGGVQTPGKCNLLYTVISTMLMQNVLERLEEKLLRNKNLCVEKMVTKEFPATHLLLEFYSIFQRIPIQQKKTEI